MVSMRHDSAVGKVSREGALPGETLPPLARHRDPRPLGGGPRHLHLFRGGNSGSPQNKLQMPWVCCSARGPLHFNMAGFGQGVNTRYGATGAGSGLASATYPARG